MSGGKLPPISFYTRRERTLMGLQLHQSLDLPPGVLSNGETLYFHRAGNNAFLPDEGSKSNRRLSKSYMTARENVHRKYNLSGKPQDISTIRLNHQKSNISIESGKLLYRNIPDGIALRKDESKIVMKCKSPVKTKRASSTAPTKYAQLRKLGLEQNVTVSSAVSPRDGHAESYKQTTEEEDEESGDKFVKKRNVTQTFRLVTKPDKTCVYPVEFQAKGLPEQLYTGHDNQKSPRITTTDKDSDFTSRNFTHGNKSDKVSLSKVELGQQLDGVVSIVTKNKTENRELYPLFDWNQQKKDDFMRVRFLDPVLRNFEETPHDNQSLSKHKPNASNHNRLFVGQSYDDIYRFVPDKVNIELDWKLIQEYRRRVRKSSEGESRHRSPSFSPLLNPPPTAMEFNFTELETLLEIPRSSSKPPTMGDAVYTPNTYRSADTPVTGLHKGNPNNDKLSIATNDIVPSINGIACKPMSTALVVSKKAKPESSRRPKTTAPLTESSEQCGELINTKDSMDKDSTVFNHSSPLPQRQQQQHALPEISNQEEDVSVLIEALDEPEIREEHPIQVVVKVVPQIIEETTPVVEEAFNNEQQIDSGIQSKKLLPNKSSSGFLAVPRIDVSFEGRRPNKETHPWDGKLQGFRENSTVVNISVSSTQEAPTANCEQDDVVTARSEQNLSSRKHVPSKNIVFVSPAKESGP